MNKISVVISAYNEEKNIRECLESVKDMADEIIVVDNSSQDKTAEIAKKYTQKIFSQQNDPEEIDLQKNFGFTKAAYPWVLSLDADERLTPELNMEIKDVLKNLDSRVNGYWIPRKNIIFNKWIRSDMWSPDYQLRLFRKGKGRFEGKSVHKSLTVTGETGKLENPILHYNYSTVSQYIEKLNNYTTIEANNLIKNEYDFKWIDAVRFPVDDFLKTFFLQKGYRDGLHGLVLSLLQAFYMEVVFAKAWERRDFVEVESIGFSKELQVEARKTVDKFKYWFMTSVIDESKNPIKKTIFKTARKVLSSKIKKD